MTTTDAPPTPSTTINIPQLAILLLVGFLAVRWILSSSNGPSRPDSSSSRSSGQPSTRASAASRGAGARVNPRHVDTVAAMFPQLGRREIMWDLQRNGGNVQATTERMLSGRGLDTPPPTFQPVIVEGGNQTLAAIQRRPEQKMGPDLIQRYNLGTKLEDVVEKKEHNPKMVWSNSKNERQSSLQKRREEMILAARQKLMKDKS